MLLVFMIMLVVTACVTVVGTYFLLNAENYHWQVRGVGAWGACLKGRGAAETCVCGGAGRRALVWGALLHSEQQCHWRGVRPGACGMISPGGWNDLARWME